MVFHSLPPCPAKYISDIPGPASNMAWSQFRPGVLDKGARSLLLVRVEVRERFSDKEGCHRGVHRRLTRLARGMGRQWGKLKFMAAARSRPSAQVSSVGLPMMQQILYSSSACAPRSAAHVRAVICNIWTWQRYTRSSSGVPDAKRAYDAVPESAAVWQRCTNEISLCCRASCKACRWPASPDALVGRRTSVAPGNRGLSVKSSAMMAPMANRSTGGPYAGARSSTSGARYLQCLGPALKMLAPPPNTPLDSPSPSFCAWPAACKRSSSSPCRHTGWSGHTREGQAGKHLDDVRLLGLRAKAPWRRLWLPCVWQSFLGTSAQGAPACGHVVGEGRARGGLASQPEVRDLHRLAPHQQVLCSARPPPMVSRSVMLFERVPFPKQQTWTSFRSRRFCLHAHRIGPLRKKTCCDTRMQPDRMRAWLCQPRVPARLTASSQQGPTGCAPGLRSRWK